MAAGEAVKNLEFTVRYAIREWSRPSGSSVFDWVRDDGDESDGYFGSLEEAEAGIRSRH